MTTSRQREALERARRELTRVSHRGLGRDAFLEQAAGLLRLAVPFDGGCWHTVDPATLLITSHTTNLSGEGFPFIVRNEYGQDDVAKFSDLAGRRAPVAVLSRVTRGHLERSARWRELYSVRGWGSELRASFDASDATWGSVMLLRETGRPDFTTEEAALIASLSRQIAHGLRTAILADAAPSPRDSDPGPGLVVLDARGELESATPEGRHWLGELTGAEPDGAPLPAVVTSVAQHASGAADRPAAAPARARVQTPGGRWLVVHGSVLGEPGPGQSVALILEPAGAQELAPLIVAAYGLTARERDIAAAVARGLSTKAIAERLVLSPYTVQDHLKSIFEKTQTNTRRELVARLFYDHHDEPVREHAPLAVDGWFA